MARDIDRDTTGEAARLAIERSAHDPQLRAGAERLLAEIKPPRIRIECKRQGRHGGASDAFAQRCRPL